MWPFDPKNTRLPTTHRATGAYNLREKVENVSMKMLAKLCMVGMLAFAVLQLVRPPFPLGLARPNCRCRRR
jgi:hypothetical protein